MGVIAGGTFTGGVWRVSRGDTFMGGVWGVYWKRGGDSKRECVWVMGGW